MKFKDLYIVTGKGGVGKSLTSLALTKSISELNHNKNVYYFSFEQNEDKELIKSLNIKTVELTHLSSVQEYIARKLNSKTIAKWIVSTSFFKALFDMVPSFGQLIFLGHIIDLAKEEENIVIVDAPASGHLLSTIHSPKVFKDIFKIGPIANDIDKMHNFLTNKEHTQCIVVSIPTELAVEEGIELRTELTNEYSISTIEILNCDLTLNKFPEDDTPDFIKVKIENQRHLQDKFQVKYDLHFPQIIAQTQEQQVEELSDMIIEKMDIFKTK
ncbi:ArsA-related P-loop ATPase [Halobacteriovorax sp. XZX-3]|uniref:ArsA-related P-loop ATPase n=1 Tax=unclassified Halobacteriovorax TaxID=2639665 RepID=UPI003713CA19